MKKPILALAALAPPLSFFCRSSGGAIFCMNSLVSIDCMIDNINCSTNFVKDYLANLQYLTTPNGEHITDFFDESNPVGALTYLVERTAANRGNEDTVRVLNGVFNYLRECSNNNLIGKRMTDLSDICKNAYCQNACVKDWYDQFVRFLMARYLALPESEETYERFETIVTLAFRCPDYKFADNFLNANCVQWLGLWMPEAANEACSEEELSRRAKCIVEHLADVKEKGRCMTSIERLLEEWGGKDFEKNKALLERMRCVLKEQLESADYKYLYRQGYTDNIFLCDDVDFIAQEIGRNPSLLDGKWYRMLRNQNLDVVAYAVAEIIPNLKHPMRKKDVRKFQKALTSKRIQKIVAGDSRFASMRDAILERFPKVTAREVCPEMRQLVFELRERA